MAETGKKAREPVVITSDPSPDVPRREDEIVNTPEPSNDANVKVRTVWPNSSFTVEGVPVITADGTNLTEAQLSTAKEAAEASGVTLTAEGVK